MVETITTTMNPNNVITKIGDSLTALNEDGDVNAPEVWMAYMYAIKNPEVVKEIFSYYVYVITKMQMLDENDLKIIERANERLNGKKLSASHVSVIDFFSKIDNRQRDLIFEVILQIGDTDSEFFQQALLDLTKRMHLGHRKSKEGAYFNDANKDYSTLIYGHTQLEDPETLIHFVICHMIERIMSAAFITEGLDIAEEKDWFFNVMTDTIAIGTLEADPVIEPVSNSWSIPRNVGGLGWLDDNIMNAFRNAKAELTLWC